MSRSPRKARRCRPRPSPDNAAAVTGPREGTLAPHAPAESESMAHLRKDKVARLRRAIKNGSFRVDVNRLVDEMLGL